MKYVVLFMIGLLLFGCFQVENGASGLKETVVHDTLALSHSWEMAVPHQEIPDGLVSLSSESCGACHQSHYKEWKTSTHAHAWTDKQFQAELKKESSPYLCINCHIPLQNQQEMVVTGLIDGDVYKPVQHKNVNFDSELQKEGINCASCHVRNGAIVGPTGTKRALHKTVQDTNHLSEQLCISCHNATAVVTPTLACSFETGDEWKAGPYAEMKTCIDCHMESIEREIVPGFGLRKSRFHAFPGSGIPKLAGDTVSMLNGMTFKTDHVFLDGVLTARIIVKNEEAGHKLPTGDPERFYLINFYLINNDGDIVARQSDRIGEHWEWHPIAKKISDNNLMPKEERSFVFEKVIQELELTSLKGFSLKMEVTKHRMSPETAAYNKLDETYPLFISVYEEVVEF